MHPHQLTTLLLTLSALSTAAVTKTRTVTECSTLTLVHHDASSTYSDISTFSTAVAIPETSSSAPNTTTASITPSITPTVTPISVTVPLSTAPVSTGSSPIIIPSGGAGGAAPSSNFTLPAGTGKAPFPTAGVVTSGVGVPTGGASSATGVPVSPPSQAPSSGASTSTVNFAVGSILALGAMLWGLC